MQEVAEKLEETMLERLQDKIPGVRLQAARVLQRLARPDEVLSPHIEPLQAHAMTCDKVRVPEYLHSAVVWWTQQSTPHECT